MKNYKNIIKKMLKRESVSEEEFTSFIVEYIKRKKGKDPTSSQLSTIIRLSHSGQLNMNYIVNEAAKEVGLTIVKVESLPTRQILKIDIYD